MTDVVMPQMGESIVEGTLTRWLKKPGEKVERDEPLFEISTDKVDTEIPAPSAGVLKEILVQEGTTVGINTIVGRIDDGGTASAAAPEQSSTDVGPSARAVTGTVSGPSAAPPQGAPTAAPAEPDLAAQTGGNAPPPMTPIATPPAASSAENYNAPQPPGAQVSGSPVVEEATGPLSPLVRKMAREYNIDLKQVKGTGAGARITKQDLENYMAQQGARTMAASVTAPQQQAQAQAGAMMPPPAPPAPGDVAPLPRAEGPKTRVEPMSTMRQKIAEHMVFSKRTSAHVTTVHKVDMTRVARMRDRHKEVFKQRYGFSLTFLPFVARAAAAALRQFPIVNASIEGTNILYHNEVNIGIAVALENGLIC